MTTTLSRTVILPTLTAALSLGATVNATGLSPLRGMLLRVLVESPIEEHDRRGNACSAFVGTSCRYAPVELVSSSSPLGEFINLLAGPRHHGRIRGAVPATAT